MSDETLEREGADASASAEHAKNTDGAPPDEVAAARGPSTPTGPSRWRRLHTAAGGVVLGAFLVEHLLTNASALGGAAAFDTVVGSLLRLRILPLFEVVFILVPLGFHAAYGIHLIRTGRTAETDIERYGDRRLSMAQRISALVLFAFVLGHVWELRIQRLFFGASTATVHTTLTAHLSWTWAGVPWIALAYIVGILAAALHLANGLYAATADWKMALDPAGRKRVRVLGSALGLSLLVAGTATVIGLATGTRLLPGADDDSGPQTPCGSAALTPPFKPSSAPPSP